MSVGSKGKWCSTGDQVVREIYWNPVKNIIGPQFLHAWWIRDFIRNMVRKYVQQNKSNMQQQDAACKSGTLKTAWGPSG